MPGEDVTPAVVRLTAANPALRALQAVTPFLRLSVGRVSCSSCPSWYREDALPPRVEGHEERETRREDEKTRPEG